MNKKDFEFSNRYKINFLITGAVIFLLGINTGRYSITEYKALKIIAITFFAALASANMWALLKLLERKIGIERSKAQLEFLIEQSGGEVIN